jgi:thiol-disulfide isomerase/thioredoxin
MLHFTASWCPYCDAEVEHLGEVAEAYGPRDVHVVLVGLKEEPGHWSEYVASHVARTVTVLDDVDGAVARKYVPPRAQPSFEDRPTVMLDTTLIIDPRGIIRLFLFPDSAHFDPTFRAVKGELDRLLAGDTTAPAAAAEAPFQRAAENVVGVEVSESPRVAPGASGALVVTLSIAPGYHVMSNHPSDPSYIPTRVRFDDAPGLSWDEPAYPAPVSFKLAQRSIDTFQGTTVLRVPFRVAPDAGPSSHHVSGTLRYQACTEGSCLFPVTRQVTATIEVLSRDTP